MSKRNSDVPIDSTDRHLIRILSRNGMLSAKEIADQLQVTVPTVHARRRRLLESGILKIAGLVDAMKIEDIIVALVALTVEKDEEIDDIIDKILELDRVTWAVVVTGRWDILVEVLLTGGMPDLYRFTTEELPKIGGIRSSESFVVMKSKNKWTLLPDRMEQWFTDRIQSKRNGKDGNEIQDR